MKAPVIVAIAGLLATAGLGMRSGGPITLLGLIDGIAVSAVSLISLKKLVRSFEINNPAPNEAARAAYLLFILKLPITAGLVILAVRLPMTAIYCFLAAVALVYSAYVWLLAGDPGA